MSKGSFTKEHSALVKGAALLMMLWHHSFLEGRFEQYALSLWPLTAYQLTQTASFFKICVSLFAFISGYGLYLSYQKSHARQLPDGDWVATRYRSTMSGYWFVVVLAWIACMAVDGRPLRIYEFDHSIARGVWNGMVDFLGLSNFFGSPILNGTWWYMSAATVFILVTPVLFRSMERMGSACTLGLIFVLPRLLGGYPGGSSWLSFLPAYYMGMVFAREALFDRWTDFWEARCTTLPRRGLKLAASLAAMAVLYVVYCRMSTSTFWDVKWGLIPVAVILFIRDYLSHIPLVSKALMFIGDHSMNIFLTHTFIRQYYCPRFTYEKGHIVLVILVLLAISIAMSYAIEGLKKLLRYEQLLGKCFGKK